jgi:hypothetical protein
VHLRHPTAADYYFSTSCGLLGFNVSGLAKEEQSANITSFFSKVTDKPAHLFTQMPYKPPSPTPAGDTTSTSIGENPEVLYDEEELMMMDEYPEDIAGGDRAELEVVGSAKQQFKEKDDQPEPAHGLYKFFGKAAHNDKTCAFMENEEIEHNKENNHNQSLASAEPNTSPRNLEETKGKSTTSLERETDHHSLNHNDNDTNGYVDGSQFMQCPRCKQYVETDERSLVEHEDYHIALELYEKQRQEVPSPTLNGQSSSTSRSAVGGSLNSGNSKKRKVVHDKRGSSSSDKGKMPKLTSFFTAAGTSCNTNGK